MTYTHYSGLKQIPSARIEPLRRVNVGSIQVVVTLGTSFISFVNSETENDMADVDDFGQTIDDRQQKRLVFVA